MSDDTNGENYSAVKHVHINQYQEIVDLQRLNNTVALSAEKRIMCSQ
jgi:hypothetical protein